MNRPAKPRKRPPRISGFILLSMGILMLLAERGSMDLALPLLIIIAGIALIIGWTISNRDKADQYQPPALNQPSPPLPPPPPRLNG